MGCHDDPSDPPAHDPSWYAQDERHKRERGLVKGPNPVTQPEMVNHPAHYLGGSPIINIDEHPVQEKDGRRFRVLECIEVIRHIRDGRLYTAMKYIWRVAFGGKANDREDIKKAIWYLNDWLDNPI